MSLSKPRISQQSTYKSNKRVALFHSQSLLALLPHTGKITATAAVAHFRKIYSHLKLFLIVGICGGVPKFNYAEDDVEILLGDVVISRRVVEDVFNGTDKFILKDTLGIYDRDIANAAIRALYGSSELRSGEESLQSDTSRFLYELQEKDEANGKESDEAKSKYQWPGTAKDRLFEANYLHKHRTTAGDCNVCNGNPDAICDNVLHCSLCNGAPNAVCDDAHEASCHEIGCDEWELVVRKSHKKHQEPTIHFEAIASGSIIVMNGLERDRISNGQGVIAFDMDGFGAWEKVPCIFIKSICDYADGHKDESWQNFAAATAAAATKAFLNKYGNHHKLEEWLDFAEADMATRRRA
ncbi:nucleoside phosphorylase domain-containing protein [Trichoderma afarasin]